MPLNYLIADKSGLILQYEFENGRNTDPLRTLDDLGAPLRELKEGIDVVLRTGRATVKIFAVEGKKHAAHLSPLPKLLFGRPAVIAVLQESAEDFQNREVTRISASQMEAASQEASIAHFRGNPKTFECYGSPYFHKLCPMRDESHILPLNEWIHPDDWERMSVHFDDLLSGKINSFTQVYRPLGFDAPRYYRTTLVHDMSDDADWFNGVLEDVTQVVLEQQRHQSDQLFWEESLDSIPVLFYAKDADNDFRYVSVNQTFADFIGTDKEEIVGKNAREIHLNDEQFRVEDEQALRSEETIRFDNEVVSRQGEKHYFRTFKKRYPGKDGQNLVVGIGVDQTDQWLLLQDFKIMNESLCMGVNAGSLKSTIRLMMERLCSHLGASHCYLLDFDDKTMKMTCSNEYVVPGQGGLLFLNKKTWTYSHTDLWYEYLLQRRVFAVHKGDADDYAEAFHHFISTIPTVTPLDVKAAYVAVLPDKKRVGATLNFIFTKSRPYFPEDRIENLLSVAIQLIQNMRGRQKQQDEVSEALRKIEHSNLAKETAILNEAVVHYCLEAMLRENDPHEAGRKSLVRMCNHLSAPRGFFFAFHPEHGTMELLLEYSKKDDTILDEGKEYTDFTKPSLYEQLQKEELVALPSLFEKLSASHIDSPWNVIITEHRLTNLYAHRIMHNNKLYGFFAVVYEDVSRNLTGLSLDFVSAIANCFELLLERKQANEALVTALEKSLAANKAKNFFIASASHELRTPLNAIIALIDLLKKGDMTESETKECFGSINYSTAALLHFVNNLIDLAQLESGSLTLSPEPTDFGELCRSVLDLFSAVADAKGLAIEQKIDVIPPLLLDQFRLRQILFNIIDNAVKYTERGSVSLNVSFERSEDGMNGKLIIAVSDTGIGMSEEDQKALFEPFVRLSRFRGTNTTSQGSGLGIVLVKRLVFHMGGTFELESRLGHGTVCNVVLDRLPLVPSSEATLNQDKKNFAGSILVVDDVPLNLKVLKAICKKADIQDIVAVESGEAALSELKKRPFDLVLTDLWMPEMSGEELAQKMRADKRLRTIPIVAVTADISAKDNFDTELFYSIILKPITLDKIIQMLSVVMPSD